VELQIELVVILVFLVLEFVAGSFLVMHAVCSLIPTFGRSRERNPGSDRQQSGTSPGK
jgi:hypothetical protein